MNKNRWQVLRVLIPLLIFILGCDTGGTPPPISVTYGNAYLAVMGEATRLAPGSNAAFLVQVRDPRNEEAPVVADAEVSVHLLESQGNGSTKVFAGYTDRNGVVAVRFPTPAEMEPGEHQMVIETTVNRQRRVLQQPVYVGRVYNVLISTDKPVYQPGQTIHIRTLALDALDLHAADGQTVTFTVSDPQGNKLLRSDIPASRYGVASLDFPLDTLAPSGDYIITAELGAAASSRSVEVKPYTLPRFAITFKTDKPFYMPDDTVTGSVEARYFFGKPVAGGQVTIRGSVTADNITTQVLEISGVTNAEGIFVYEFTTPASFAGRLNNRKAKVDINIAVTDTANHREEEDEEITVAERILLIDAVPESGTLRPGLENLIYIDVSYPDGAAAQAGLVVSGRGLEPITTTTDIYGLAVISLTPPSRNLLALQVVATDAAGNVVEQPLTLGGEMSDAGGILLRPDRTAYAVGDTMNLDIYVAGGLETVFLDVIKDRQTFALQELPVNDGVAQVAIPLDGSLLGTLEINAYAALPDALLSDRRLVLVEPAAAAIDVTADAEVYRPGDTARLDIAVTRDGAPMPGVVGVAIVDESVFSIAEQEPGFARSYFLLDRELQEPRYGLHGYADLEDADSPYDGAPPSIQFAQRGRQLALAGWFAQELAAQADEAVAAAPAAPDQPLAALPWGNRLYLLAPLAGIALYDGSRRRRQLLIALVIFSLGAFVWGACSAPAAAPAPLEAPAEETASTDAAAGAPDSQPPRLRQYFPETLYWQPEVETDSQGRARLDVPIADSITTWRVSLLASDEFGNLGSADVGLRVFQDFFVEPELPRFLTVGDEVEAPISLFNYLDRPQTVELTFQADDWFEFLDADSITVELAANEVAGVSVPIRITGFGQQEFVVTARGDALSDAVARSVEVLPNGQPLATVHNGQLAAAQSFTLQVPADAVPGASRATLRIYPSVIAEAVQGMEALLAEPYGCFEQTTSTTYPNVLVLDYLRRTGGDPAVAARAERLIALGYQRLLGFEVLSEPGGFSLYGDAPAVPAITAYGLQEFSDMSEVAFVDPALLDRIVAYLESRQFADGSWLLDRYSASAASADEGRIISTAYVVWGLADSGHADSYAVARGLDYLSGALAQAAAAPGASGGAGSSERRPGNREDKAGAASPVAAGAQAAAGYPSARAATPSGPTVLSPYALALVANAYVAAGADATPLLDELLERSTVSDTGGRYWPSAVYNFFGGYGESVTIETTALVAQALLRAGYALPQAQETLAYLTANRDESGGFYTTQATIQALKALILAAASDAEQETATITVTLTGADGSTAIRTLTVDDANADVMQQFVFDNIEDGATIAVAVEGERTLPFQLVTDYYLPWGTAAVAAGDAPVQVDVRYDRTEIAVNETVDVEAVVEVVRAERNDTLIVAVGVPPGFTPDTAGLERLERNHRIDRYELLGNRIVFYLSGLTSGDRLVLPYALQAHYVVRAQTPSGAAYNYYAPDAGAVLAPQRIVVTLAAP